MQHRRVLSAVTFLVAYAIGCTHAPAERTTLKKIVFGLNPSEKAENVQRNARVLASMIERRVGMPVEIFVAQDYSGLVEALRSRTIDFAFLAPLSYVFAERVADAHVLLKAERNGHPYYYGAIVVNADSSFRKLDDLRGHTIAWVDPSSTSGHLFPKAALIAAGIDPDAFFGQQTFAGGHDAVILSVVNGTISAGATFANDTLGRDGSWTQLANGRFRNRIRPIFYSPPIPGDNLSTANWMLREHPDVVARVKRAVMALTSDSAGRALMQEMYHVDAMIPATSADYQPVRDAAEALDIDITGAVGKGGARNERISEIVFAVFALLGLGALVFQSLRARRRVATGINPSRANHAPHGLQIAVRDLSVDYPDRRGGRFRALSGVSVDIRRGEFVAVVGLSGAGKTTFLRCLNRTVEPTDGAVYFEGRDVTHIEGGELRELRRRIGFVFQQFNLVSRLTVLQNVLAGRLAGVSAMRGLLGLYPQHDRDIARHYLDAVGLGDKVPNRADALSGGQQQRVAIARALAQQPKVILADEPMASLDPKLAEVVLSLLRRFNQEESITVIVNLHVMELARRYADRILAFRAGRLVFDGTPEQLTPELTEQVYRTEAQELDAL